ncbi:MAG: NAD(P)/FAD-dependent oxidoreductase [Methanocorpusculum sp.]|uniref:NAD(P)/FAD-dependent oxidoreductase n=1 Tax=Methanocorpusculum sp. TaxID=2058474 RepID=UPI0027210FA2|nr:NAD(P)/FAD-dependent oxidoreductase [Methanocorpusculum sp.]MDO9523301.1 NAD(P)/FAD-dependent oxidoreductase [Methanocorpusculum sp.]
MKIGILGSGLAGLSAALQLADKNEVVIFEKNDSPGGCMSSLTYNNTYTLETLYHHCFSGDTNLFSLLENLDLKTDMIWLKGSTGYYMDGKLHPLTTPLEILRYPCLTFFQKFRLGLFVISSRKINLSQLDKVTAKEYLFEKVGKDIYNAFFAPLLTSKFGSMKDDVSAAWLMSRIAIRSDRGTEGERLGYLKGGWHKLIDAMMEKLEKMGAEIRLSTPVITLVRKNEKWQINGEEFDAVISTLPPQITNSLMGNSTDKLPDLMYQGAACMTLGLARDPTNGIYWTNMGDPAPYGAVVTHTNFVPFKWYGEHVVYLASYFKDEPDSGLKDRMIDDFCKRFSIDISEIHHADLYIDRFAGPVYVTGYKDSIPPANIGDNLFIAGMFSPENYPERSMEGSISAGLNAAKLLEENNR